MGDQIDQEKPQALAAERAKEIKSEQDLGILTQQLLKLTVAAALPRLALKNDQHLPYVKSLSSRDIVDEFKEMQDADISAARVSKMTERVI